MHLAQLDKRSRKFPWGDFLRTDVPIRVETTTRKSRISSCAATQRIERAINETAGVEISTEAELVLKVRILMIFAHFQSIQAAPRCTFVDKRSIEQSAHARNAGVIIFATIGI